MIWITLVPASLALLFVAQDTKQPQPHMEATPEQIREWTAKLGDESPQIRDEATTRLIEAGPAAIEAVRKHAAASDPEIKSRANRVLDAIDSRAAEEAFKKIERKLSAAKTLSVNFTVGPLNDAGNVEQRISGTLLLKDGNKGLVTYRTGLFPTPWIRVSDGKKIRVSRIKFEEATPEDFTSGCLTGLARMGWMPTVFLAFQILDIGEQGALFQKFAKSLRVEQFRSGKDEDEKKSLKYQGSCVDPYQPNKTLRFESELWYEPKTFVIVKRIVRTGKDELFEAFSEFTFNSDIPDERFKLPQER